MVYSYLMQQDIPLDIIKNPRVLGGMPTVGGTRISIAEVLTALSEGESVNQIVSALRYAGYKKITAEHIFKVIEYARDKAS